MPGYNPRLQKQFRKDYKRIEKQGKNVERVVAVMRLLAAGGQLDPAYLDHQLTGNHKGRRACHVEPDLVLLYLIQENDITFIRVGSHSELFRK